MVAALLSVIIGIFATTVQTSSAAGRQLMEMGSKVETVVEIRPIGSLGSGGLREEPLPFSSVEKIRGIPNIVEIEKYIIVREIDRAKDNPFAIVVGLEPDSEMRAVGGRVVKDSELIIGRKLMKDDSDKSVAVVGRVFAEQRVIHPDRFTLNNTEFRAVGIYESGNNFVDNQAFIPIDAAERAYSAKGLSKIFITVDSVENVGRVAEDVKRMLGEYADILINAEEVTTARDSLASMRKASLFGSIFFFIIASALVVYVMLLATRNRIREIGTFKAIGASNLDIAAQFVIESLVLTAMGGAGGAAVYYLSQGLLESGLSNIEFGIATGMSFSAFLTIAFASLALAIIGSLYPVVKALRLSPVEAMRYE